MSKILVLFVLLLVGVFGQEEVFQQAFPYADMDGISFFLILILASSYLVTKISTIYFLRLSDMTEYLLSFILVILVTLFNIF